MAGRFPYHTDPDGSDTAPPHRTRLFAYNGGLLGPGTTARRLRRILSLAGYDLRLGLPDAGDAVAVWGHGATAHRGTAIAARRGATLIRLEDAFLRSIHPGRAGSEPQVSGPQVSGPQISGPQISGPQVSAQAHSRRPGGGPPLGILIDKIGGAHYAPAGPSSLERLLATHPLDDAALLARARTGIARLRAADLSKYNAHEPSASLHPGLHPSLHPGLHPSEGPHRLPAPGYVLVIDQVRGDAALTEGGLDGPLPPNIFREILVHAQADHPMARIVIKTHPESQGTTTQIGPHAHHTPPDAKPSGWWPTTTPRGRTGHYTHADARGRITLLDTPVSPHALLEGAIAVYTVSSQLGFEAIMAGHRPRVFGMPFYAGWGLTEDATPHPRRTRRLTRTQLFAAAMILAPVWYDAHRDRLCSFEEALNQLEATTRAWREDRHGHVALNMRLWKRGALQGFFGKPRPVQYTNDPMRARSLLGIASKADASVGAPPTATPSTGQSAPAPSTAKPREAPRPGLLIWASHDLPDWAQPPAPASDARAPASAPLIVRRVEDGFLRSRGLGAQLVPPLSLVADPLGIYYDPTRPSTLERLIAAPPPPGYADRAEALRRQIITAGLSKYNLGGTGPSRATPPQDRPPRPDPQDPLAGALPRRGGSGTAPQTNSQPTQAGNAPTDDAHDRPAARSVTTRAASTASPRLRILVPGQVEDDASIRLGAGNVRTNLDLLRAVRTANPDAHITYKPHPDVEAGLRPGAIPNAAACTLADIIASHADPIALIDACDAVWTITSLLGFEALIRHKPVTCLGVPFYAGWGLTTDLCDMPRRRQEAARPDLAALIHATLIAYPRYRDPVTGTPCPPEVVAERLATGTLPRPGLALRWLAKLQGMLASRAGLWR
ncbi:capsular polysaccharide biosynthesis protein [Roseicitreum antarcticum]|uniref:Capsule polysaccharide biosynthesis protein n=1 Tax=Roseicitreum antarcticum TaxID=564137 RepID=A0A1H3D8S0_9RHOB|nr:capsular polysaccharide biosynthesis protein [Roseicitreum antarcticum]SDX62785.1 Capsule polysaccharide biosynthesis protein [Roseicitreum antarcticum]